MIETPDEMIEAAAKALANRMFNKWDAIGESLKDCYRRDARKALEAAFATQKVH